MKDTFTNENKTDEILPGTEYDMGINETQSTKVSNETKDDEVIYQHKPQAEVISAQSYIPDENGELKAASVENKKVRINITSLSIATATLTEIAEWTGLKGDTDNGYEIVLELVCNTNLFDAGILSLRINGASGASDYFYNIGSTFGTGNGSEFRAFANAGAVDISSWFGKITIKADKTVAGTRRLLISEVMALGTPAVGNNAIETKSGFWINTTDEVSSVQLYITHSAGANRTVSGRVTLYPINI